MDPIGEHKLMPMHEYDANETRSEYMARMVEEGNTIVIPKDNELQIDIDSEEQYQIFQECWAIFKREFKEAKIIKDKPSRSGLPKRHITIHFPYTSFKDKAELRIAWQATLGSDPKRELLSLIRCDCGDDQPTLFVEEKSEWLNI
jgi:hypothetical protein